MDSYTIPADLHSLLDDLAVISRLQAEEKGLSFSLKLEANLPRCIVADLGKLRQVLANLLGNAIKFTRQGSIAMRAIPAGADRIIVEVKDSGIGIAQDELEKLFRPFERTIRGEETAGGTGLGLAISREYAHLMGGDIQLESRVGEGSCFRLEFHAPIPDVLPALIEPRCRELEVAQEQGESKKMVPSIGLMPAEWREAFARALAEGSVTSLRDLWERAQYIDRQLSDFIAERIAQYEIKALRDLLPAGEAQASQRS